MNTLQTTLTALKSQLESQKEASKYYFDNVFSKEVFALEARIVEWFHNLTGDTYTIKLESGGETLQIFAPGENVENAWRHNGVTIYHYERYKEEAKARLSYYSTECEYDNVKVISYLKTVGKVAELLPQINDMMPVWKAEYKYYSEKRYVTFEQPIGQTEFAIRKTEQQIADETIAAYKQPGFKHTISSRTVCERDWDVSNYDCIEAYKLETKPQYFDLQHGRGRFDHVRVYAFEVVGAVKGGKIELNIMRPSCDPNQVLFTPIQVTKARFDDFIATVYYWETKQREEDNAKQTERYNNHVSRYTTTVEA